MAKDFEREAVWNKLGKRTIDTFDIRGDWAILTGLNGQELATRVHVPTAVKEFCKKKRMKKSRKCK